MFVTWFRRPAALIAVGLMIILGSAAQAAAHEAGTSAMEIRSSSEGLAVQLDAPIVELSEAVGIDIPTDAFGLSQVGGEVGDYLVANLEITGSDGEPMTVTGGRLTVVTIDGIEFLRAEISARGDISSTFPVRDQVILENDDSHRVLVTVTDDERATRIAGTIDADDPELVTAISADVAEAVADDPESGDGAAVTDSGFMAMLDQGFLHVLDGADHMLFLLTLLLPAPLSAVGGRWRASPDGWNAARKVVRLATAFTLGHSLSLAASALGVIDLPSRPIEILIAVSVGVSAIHAIRPLAKGGELAIAAGFGLVHGLAFGEILNNLNLDSATTIKTLLAFNLGIEAAQLLTIALTFPSFWLLSRTPIYPAVRLVGATVALVASISWIVDRFGWFDNLFAEAEDWAVDHLLTLAIGLAVVAVVAWGWWRFSKGTASPQNAAIG